jgi:PhnB protein
LWILAWRYEEFMLSVSSNGKEKTVKTALVPYLNFDGQASEALEFYQSVFGGELTMQTYAEANMGDSPEMADRIIHASLQSETISLMASDTHPQHSPPLRVGNNVNLTIIGSDQDELTEYFNKLAEGGTIDMPLEEQFWGDIYGVLTDKFGIPWMIDIAIE